MSKVPESIDLAALQADLAASVLVFTLCRAKAAGDSRTPKRWRGEPRSDRRDSVEECASPLALWPAETDLSDRGAGVEFISANRVETRPARHPRFPVGFARGREYRR